MKSRLSPKNVVNGLLSVGALIGCVSSSLPAAPSLDVRKPPVVSGVDPFTGPGAVDPTATLGQWFRPASGGAPQARSHEFHDNAQGQGGGVFGTRAIYGAVAGIVYLAGPGTAIVGFKVNAVVRNDTDSVSGASQPGANAHGEKRVAAAPYKGALYRPILVAEFALTSNAFFPAGPIAGTPYTLSPGPRIVAVNHDMVAWYCFSNTPVAGNYYVPGWQLPTVPLHASVTVGLQFRVLDGGLLPTDPRYTAVVKSLSTGADILSNRTTSLKISNWVDRLFVDTGARYYTFGRSSER